MADCKNFLETSLVLVGEIGVNDYNFAILKEKASNQYKQSFLKLLKQ